MRNTTQILRLNLAFSAPPLQWALHSCTPVLASDFHTAAARTPPPSAHPQIALMTHLTKKNILLVGNWRSDTGYAWQMIERFWIAIARAFPDRHTLLCFPEIGTINPEIQAAGIEVVQCSFDFDHPNELTTFCRQNDIGLIYLTDRPYTSRIYRHLRRSGVQRIIVHDHTPGQRTPPSALKAFIKKMNVNLFGADAYIACSEQVLDRMIVVGCLSPHHCHLARNGIDITQFPSPSSTIRQELSIPRDTLLVVSCSRLHPYKRVRDIVDAAAHLKDLPLHFIHVGDGPEINSIQFRISELGLESRFTLLGHRNDVPQILSGCDIAAHASNGEVGLCLAILEFMASKLPLAVTDEPTVSQIIEPGINGLTFAHGNVSALAERLRALTLDNDLRERLGRAARRTVESRHHIDDTVSAVVATIRDALTTSL